MDESLRQRLEDTIRRKKADIIKIECSNLRRTFGEGGDFNDNIYFEECDEGEQFSHSDENNVNVMNWERECDRIPIRFNTGFYNLKLNFQLNKETNNNALVTSQPVVVKIEEEYTHLGTRVWDTSVLMAKWFEKAQIEHHLRQRVKEEHELSPAEKSINHKPSSAPILLSDQHKQKPLTILELGSGCGLLAIALALYGGAVVATEHGSKVVRHLARNCHQNAVWVASSSSSPSSLEGGPDEEFNGTVNNDEQQSLLPGPGDLVGGKVKCHELDWYSPIRTTTEEISSPKYYDLIVASDCTLTPSDASHLLETILRFIPSPSDEDCHTEVLIGVCKEREGTSHFVRLAKELFYPCRGDDNQVVDSENLIGEDPVYTHERGGIQQQQQIKRRGNFEQVDPSEYDKNYRSERLAIYRMRFNP